MERIRHGQILGVPLRAPIEHRAAVEALDAEERVSRRFIDVLVDSDNLAERGRHEKNVSANTRSAHSGRLRVHRRRHLQRLRSRNLLVPDASGKAAAGRCETEPPALLDLRGSPK